MRRALSRNGRGAGCMCVQVVKQWRWKKERGVGDNVRQFMDLYGRRGTATASAGINIKTMRY